MGRVLNPRGIRELRLNGGSFGSGGSSGGCDRRNARGFEKIAAAFIRFFYWFGHRVRSLPFVARQGADLVAGTPANSFVPSNETKCICFDLHECAPDSADRRIKHRGLGPFEVAEKVLHPRRDVTVKEFTLARE